LADVPPYAYPDWERLIYFRDRLAPLHRVTRRWALRQIVRTRWLYPDEIDAALEAIGDGPSPIIDPNTLGKLQRDITADSRAYRALLAITPWRAPRGDIYGASSFAEDKIALTLPIHLVLTLLLDLRERALATLEWIKLVREFQRYSGPGPEPKDHLLAPINLLKKAAAFADRYARVIGETAAALIRPRSSLDMLDALDADRAYLRRISDTRTPAWMIIGVARRFIDAGKAAMTAAVGALAVIVRAATGKLYASSLGQLIRIAAADDSFLVKDAIADAERSFRQALAAIHENEEAPA
jgi:hypothetical protein